jgi:hypothetical protein
MGLIPFVISVVFELSFLQPLISKILEKKKITYNTFLIVVNLKYTHTQPPLNAKEYKAWRSLTPQPSPKKEGDQGFFVYSCSIGAAAIAQHKLL